MGAFGCGGGSSLPTHYGEGTGPHKPGSITHGGALGPQLKRSTFSLRGVLHSKEAMNSIFLPVKGNHFLIYSTTAPLHFHSAPEGRTTNKGELGERYSLANVVRPGNSPGGGVQKGDMISRRLIRKRFEEGERCRQTDKSEAGKITTDTTIGRLETLPLVKNVW